MNWVRSSTVWSNRSIWWNITSTIKTLQFVINHFICTQQIIYSCKLYLRKVIHKNIRSLFVYLDCTSKICSNLTDRLQKPWIILPYWVFCNCSLPWPLCQQCHFLTSSLSFSCFQSCQKVWLGIAFLCGLMHFPFIFSYNIWIM